jgi:hypothetical protein
MKPVSSSFAILVVATFASLGCQDLTETGSGGDSDGTRTDVVRSALHLEGGAFADDVHFMDPLAEELGERDDADGSLVDLLVVSVCRVQGEGCTEVVSYDAAGEGAAELRLSADGSNYQSSGIPRAPRWHATRRIG